MKSIERILSLREAGRSTKYMVLMGAILLTYATAYLYYPTYGVMAFSLTVVPILIAAWYFGLTAGLSLAVLLVTGNTVLQSVWGVPVSVSLPNDLPGILAVLLIALITGCISELADRYQQLSRQLKEKNASLEEEMRRRKETELLYAEVNHRIKNNLSMVAGILELEGMKGVSGETTDVLDNVKNRIYTIASLHEQLYKHDLQTKVQMGEFISQLLESNFQNGKSTNGVTINSYIEPVVLDGQLAITIALIINELVTNALKHAFRGQPHGSVSITLKDHRDSLELKVEDDGKGLPENFTTQSLDLSDSIGMELVMGLVDQWNGTLDYENNNGARFEIVLQTTGEPESASTTYL